MRLLLERADMRVYRPDWCCDRELPDCVDDAQPSCHARKIAIRRVFFGSFGAFRHCFVAIPREHQVGDTPDVDFRYHAGRLSGGSLFTVNSRRRAPREKASAIDHPVD